jgi:hypothetical protein
MTHERFNVGLVCAVAFVATIIYPPWVNSFAVEPVSWLAAIDRQTWLPDGTELTKVLANRAPPAASQLVCTSIGYSWLWEPPSAGYPLLKLPGVKGGGVRPDLARLSMEWLAIAAVFSSLFWASSPRTVVPQPAQ